MPFDARSWTGATGENRVGRPFSRGRGLLNDAVLLLLVAMLFPLVILLIGSPVALFVRILVEIAKRL